NDGITWNENFVFVVDENDMQEPFSIDPSGDEIMFVNEQEYIYDQISFGVNVNPPFAGQSLARIGLDAGPPIGEEFFLLVKENQPSIGCDPFSVSSYGTFTGYVYDSLMNPVENVQLEGYPPLGYGAPEIVTDENGHYSADLPGMNYDFNVHLLYLATIDTIVTIEPDTQNYYEFVFENYVSSDDIEIELPSSYYDLTNYPNPFNPITEISFSVPQTSSFVKIEIFNSRGQKVKTLGCSNSLAATSKELTHSIVWDGTNENNKQVPSGVYLYKLVSNGKELATNKMLLLK
ncbi:MAG: T9SS type A sorting domain-containing protein, partial [Candidatus Cloacimonetes bacterium]|nr:T9SS type A sorting domain-containing protein [Candidatus Cloacimonadota bacterium]